MPHINSLQSKMWPGTLANIHFTLFAYALVKICPPHWIYMSHCTSTVVQIYTQKFLHISVKKTLIYQANAIYVPTTNMLLKCHIKTKAQITWCALMGEVCQYTSHKWTHCHQPCDQRHFTQLTMMLVIMLTTIPKQPDCISWVGHWPKITLSLNFTM